MHISREVILVHHMYNKCTTPVEPTPCERGVVPLLYI